MVIDGDTIEVHNTRIRLYGVVVHENSQFCEETTHILLRGLRIWCNNDFLRLPRGGEGALLGQMPNAQIAPYMKAVQKIAFLYVKSKWQLYANTTDNIPCTININ